MPEEDYLWLPREDILQFEEIERLVDQFLRLGVDKVRTDNDSTNAPILHLNEQMGYRRRADMIQLMRSAEHPG